MRTEPLITVATITAGVAATLTLLVVFGVPLSADQQSAILGVVAVAAPLVVAALARRSVTPQAKVLEYEQGGYVVAGPANEVAEAGDVIRSAAALADEDYVGEHFTEEV